VAAPDPSSLDVDTRFLLANERTLLAWVRTALTLIAGGVGIEQFGSGIAGRTTWATVLLALGVASAVTGAARYRRADRALRGGRVPATGMAAYGVALAVAVLGGGLAAALLLG
jgi:putative membrane protein